MANKYLDLTGLQDFATKLSTKLHTIFATKADVGAPLVASTVAGMTDHDRIYVYTGSETGYTNGNWYYWDGTAWTSGGTYNSQAIGDGTITTAKLASGAVTAEKIADGAVVNSVNGETGAVTGVAMDDGYYENMTVGSADQLISSVNIEDKVPYVFRTSGGANDIGDREVDEIVGGTIAFNQYAKEFKANNWVAQGTGASVSFADGIATLTATAQYNRIIMTPSISKNAHKVLVRVELYPNFAGAFMAGVWSSDASNTSRPAVVINPTVANTWQVAETVGILEGGNDNKIQFQLNSGTGTVQLRNPLVVDLTQMFGSAIADYIYSLEQANAGAGVAWFKSLFPKPYYPYNTGQLISISGLSAHKMTGFNQWDEEWEQGGINPDSGENAGGGGIRTKNYIPVLPNQTYFAYVGGEKNLNLKTRWYDANKSYLGSSPAILYNSTFTVPSNACYLRFCPQDTYGTVYKNDICINLAWDGERNGEYESYESHSYALDSDVTLRGIPKLDADNKLYYDGDIYQSDGTVQRRYDIVDLGTLTWGKSGGASESVVRYFTNSKRGEIKPATSNGIVANAICSKYKTAGANDGYNGREIDCITVDTNGSISAYMSATYADATAFTTAMNGVMLVYELETPTTESADPYTNPQIVDDWGTEEYVIAEQSGVKMPVGHETAYKPNLRAKLEMSPDSPSSGDGDYIVRQTNGTNEYVPLVIPTELPTNPSSDGTYILKATVSGGTTTLSWEVQS